MRKFLRDIWISVKLFWFHLTKGMINADQLISNAELNDSSSDIVTEKQQEKKSVIQDLLNGVLSEEVMELRHEMYYAERKSNDYVYAGGGRAKKKGENELFGYNGNVERSDGQPVKIVMVNRVLSRSVTEELDDATLQISKTKDYSVSCSRNDEEYSFTIDRTFIPRYRIEKYATKLVVKDINEEKAYVDIYVSQYPQQFDILSKRFVNEIEKVYNGERRNDIVDFKTIKFITNKCYGVPDHFYFEYERPRLQEVIKFDGSYVLRFECDIVCNGEDKLDEIYHAPTAEKIASNKRRENSTADFESMKLRQMKDEFDTSEMEEIFDNVQLNKKKHSEEK